MFEGAFSQINGRLWIYSHIEQRSSPRQPPTSPVASSHSLFLSQLCFLTCKMDTHLGFFTGVNEIVWPHFVKHLVVNVASNFVSYRKCFLGVCNTQLKSFPRASLSCKDQPKVVMVVFLVCFVFLFYLFLSALGLHCCTGFL